MGWFERAATATAQRGEEPRSRFARWTARWRSPSPSVPRSQFQGNDDPYPEHWREYPAPWPETLTDADLEETVNAAIEDLPPTWRRVLTTRDVEGRGSLEVSAALGLTPAQERAVLNKARAKVRHAISSRLGTADDQ